MFNTCYSLYLKTAWKTFQFR